MATPAFPSNRPAGDDSASVTDGDTHQKEDTVAAQVQLVDELVSNAAKAIEPSVQRTSKEEYWRAMSSNVQAVFDMDVESDGPQFNSHTLGQFVQLYLERFGPLWPLLSLQNLDINRLHPLLYLTLTSIGAMYGGTSQSVYGSMMHIRIRKTLTVALELEDVEEDYLWLAQARLLTQVAALYFGQAKAFSYAQHLGGLLVAQIRRTNLLSATQSMVFQREAAQTRVPSEQLSLWLYREARRRLAFGILRADIYTSVLLNICPLLLPEEIDLELPSCELAWRGEKLPTNVCLQLIEQDRTLGRNLRFADIHRIALDEYETLPLLEPGGQELLLSGLQQSVWRFSHDRTMFPRLTGQEKDLLVAAARGDLASLNPGPDTEKTTADLLRQEPHQPAKISSEADHLEAPARKMVDLHRECDRLISAVQKWKQSLDHARMLVHVDRDRDSLLSSLLLYHLSYLRLHAPIEDLHQISYRLADGQNLQKSLITAVQQWANTPRADIAARHACSIWSLIAKETQRAEPCRAKFNLLAYTGLHHSAVVLWSYAGARVAYENILKLEFPDTSKPDIPIDSSHSNALITSFAHMYGLISPARWSSFAQAATKLSMQKFPLPEV